LLLIDSRLEERLEAGTTSIVAPLMNHLNEGYILLTRQVFCSQQFIYSVSSASPITFPSVSTTKTEVYSMICPLPLL